MLASGVLAAASAAQAPRVSGGAPDPDSILSYIDDLYRSTSSRAEMVMRIETPHWRRELRMNVWTEGLDKTLIRIISPRKEKGVATLRVGNEMWNYLPKINKVIKVPPSMMMGSWMGSDFTNDDLVDEFTYRKDYASRLVHPAGERADLYYIECIPRENLPVVWGSVTIAVRKSDWMPAWEKYYDEKGRLLRTLSFREIKRFGDREIPAVMELVPAVKEGHRTVLEYLSVSFDVDLGTDVFSLRNLRSR
jgi:outer membrane lipoprotein-sorting protein